MTCACGLRPPKHFECKGCGMHVVTDYEPCPSCRYFKFSPVGTESPAQQVPEPMLAVSVNSTHPNKPTRREKRRAAQ